LTQAGAKADILVIIQLVPLFFKKHLDFAADLFRMSLLAYQQVYSFIKTSVFMLSLFHALVIMITNSDLFFQNNLQLYDFIVYLTHC